MLIPAGERGLPVNGTQAFELPNGIWEFLRENGRIAPRALRAPAVDASWIHWDFHPRLGLPQRTAYGLLSRLAPPK